MKPENSTPLVIRKQRVVAGPLKIVTAGPFTLAIDIADVTTTSDRRR